MIRVCLFRFLATGDSYTTIAFSYRVGLQTVCNIVNETCDAIWKRLQPLYMPTPTRQHWEDTATGFLTQWQFPNCLGALDGKHVQIVAPRCSGSNFFNYKKTFSVVLLGLVDHRYCFLVVDIGSYGSNSDGGILKKSQLGRNLANNTLDIPCDKPLPGFEETEPVPHVIIGDEAFPSGEHLVRPVPGKNLSEQERVFNYRLSRARRISENCFGILANRWRLYHRKIPLQPTNVDKVVKATCVLHNMLQMHGVPVPPPPQAPDLHVNPGEDLHDGILREIERVGGRPPIDAIAIRDTFKRYFVSNAGSVPWQHDYCFGHAR